MASKSKKPIKQAKSEKNLENSLPVETAEKYGNTLPVAIPMNVWGEWKRLFLGHVVRVVDNGEGPIEIEYAFDGEDLPEQTPAEEKVKEKVPALTGQSTLSE